MEFVGQILIKLEMSFIGVFRESSCEVLCWVINANTAVATQWPLKHAIFVIFETENKTKSRLTYSETCL